MLSTDDIIQLYDNQDYDTILDNLKMDRSAVNEKSQKILQYAISTSNIQLFTHTFTQNNLYTFIILELGLHPILHPQFELLLANDCNLCNSLGSLINSITEVCYSGAKLMKIIVRYVSNIDNKILGRIFNHSVILNDISTLESIIISGADIKFSFRFALYNRINIATFAFLEENNIDMSVYINEVSRMYCYQNNIDGIIFCLNCGSDINYLLKGIPEEIPLHIIKFIIENNADINYLSFNKIKNLSDWRVMEYLVDSGLDIKNDLNLLMVWALKNNNIGLAIYYIKLGLDINLNNGLFLLTAIKFCHINMVEALLDHGANPNITSEISALLDKFNIK